jgi:hypothetical protein
VGAGVLSHSSLHRPRLRRRWRGFGHLPLIGVLCPLLSAGFALLFGGPARFSTRSVIGLRQGVANRLDLRRPAEKLV